jgi:hypothetical protein
MLDWLGALQWPAMAVTVTAAYLVASSSKRRRHVGFWLFLASNVLWVVWGFHTRAYALITLQFCLAAMNIRGERKSAS